MTSPIMRIINDIFEFTVYLIIGSLRQWFSDMFIKQQNVFIPLNPRTFSLNATKVLLFTSYDFLPCGLLDLVTSFGVQKLIRQSRSVQEIAKNCASPIFCVIMYSIFTAAAHSGHLPIIVTKGINKSLSIKKLHPWAIPVSVSDEVFHFFCWSGCWQLNLLLIAIGWITQIASKSFPFSRSRLIVSTSWTHFTQYKALQTVICCFMSWR